MLAAALAQYRLQKALTARTARDATALWSQVDPNAVSASWAALAPRLTVTVAAAQLLAAAQADRYVTAALDEQGIPSDTDARIAPRAFAGVASDGRDLGTLLEQPAIAAKVALAGGQAVDAALATGLARLVRIVGTQVADAGRGAESVATVTRPRADRYVRMLTLPSCSRCAVLAGRIYRLQDAFQRHPLCDCRHVPTAEDVAGDLRTDALAAVRSGRVTGLSVADRQAIADGADVGQVINARRGMSTTTAYGRRLKTTTEGTTVRGVAGQRLGGPAAKTPGARYRSVKAPRLRPEEIYRQADGRGDALRLLRLNGYLL